MGCMLVMRLFPMSNMILWNRKSELAYVTK